MPTATRWIGRIQDADDYGDALTWAGAHAFNEDVTLADAKKVITDQVRAIDGDGLKLYEDGGAGIFVEDGGQVGLGTEAPTGEFHISGAHTALTSFLVFDSSDSLGQLPMEFNINSTLQAKFRCDWNGGVNWIARKTHNFYTGGDAGVGTIKFHIALDGDVGIGTSTPGSITEWNMATENLEFVDAGSAAATEQDWIEVRVGGNAGYVHVFAAK